MSLTKLLVPTYVQMLKALSGWLKKAEAQMPKENAEALLAARLAPDMFPLSTQIRFVCVQAQEPIYRLRGEAFPESLHQLVDEGRDAIDKPGSLAEAQARIHEALDLLEGLVTDALDADPDAPIVHELPSGMIFDLTAEQYARDWTLAQFYFHLMTAYAILRSEKVELGKVDYIPHMLGFLRPETISEA
ncbi:DUF1993 domain-containing protein [Parasphingorhabdus cellanae]|uniref:DUF1993 domain-containing protein n=1 Tax=Parasphingorhabdus cellanae TaxID=2806553 RepID=A0ABX7T8U2_9SPHN|nr:DUF1993 domain-containing protein [Parasphingorhabdus cellanae]QTD56942.1 DUF1993 domain-containing protein [Parasphingorhabdus cellanae]